MDPKSIYYKKVALLVRVLPWLEEEACFALKGGTAINLFVRDMPRLSVDIDLAYLPIEPREDSLAHIHEAMMRLANTLQQKIPGSVIEPVLLRESGTAYKLLIRHAGVQIKVEVTPVLRGTVYPSEQCVFMPSVEDEFGFAEVLLVSRQDLYGGKICAALDRQHPRDLFDIKLLLENEGFLVYLISHNRPISELLAPHEKDIAGVFVHHFDGMTREPITLDELFEARRQLVAEIQRQFTADDKTFLLCVKQGDPDWSLIDLPHVNELPAVQWKLKNLENMSEGKHRAALERLEQVLEQF